MRLSLLILLLSTLIAASLFAGCAAATQAPLQTSATGPYLGPASLQLTASSGVVLAGYAVRLMCRVPRDAAHRHLRIVIDGPYSRSHGVELDGLAGQITHERYFEDLVCGSYELACEVYGVGARLLQRRAVPLTVVGAGCDGDVEV